MDVLGTRDPGQQDPVLSSRSSVAWKCTRQPASITQHGRAEYKAPWGSNQRFLSQTPKVKEDLQGEETLY